MHEDAPRSLTVATASDVREFFRESLVETLKRRRLEVCDETGVYLVNLLAEFGHSQVLFTTDETGHAKDEPLAFMLKRALESDGVERQKNLKKMGDTALYVSGFFADSLGRGAVDADYYANMGGRAYESLAGVAKMPVAQVFAELAGKFLRIADVLTEMSERACLSSDAGLLKLYERYVRTGSERLRDVLRDRGMSPALLVPGVQ